MQWLMRSFLPCSPSELHHDKENVQGDAENTLRWIQRETEFLHLPSLAANRHCLGLWVAERLFWECALVSGKPNLHIEFMAALTHFKGAS